MWRRKQRPMVKQTREADNSLFFSLHVWCQRLITIVEEKHFQYGGWSKSTGGCRFEGGNMRLLNHKRSRRCRVSVDWGQCALSVIPPRDKVVRRLQTEVTQGTAHARNRTTPTLTSQLTQIERTGRARRRKWGTELLVHGMTTRPSCD